MSNGSGVNTTKTGLIKGGIIAALFCTIIIGWGLLKSAEYGRQADDKRAEYSEYTREKVTQACIRTPLIERLKCVDEAFEAKREYEANQYDLEAQRKSALWAYIMGAAAVIGMALSAVGVWLVKTTFEETRKANHIAGDIGFKQLRAYVTVENAIQSDASFTGDNDGFLPVCLTLHNSGSTPATDVRVNLRKNVVIDRKAAHVEETFTSPDIGGQARQNIDLPWYKWDDFYYANDPSPSLIGGEIRYKTAIPDDEGQFPEFSTNFSIKPADTNRRKVLEVSIVRMPHGTGF